MIAAIWRAFGVDPVAHGVLHRTFWDLSRRGGSALVARKTDARAVSMTPVYLIYGSLGLLTSLSAWFGASPDSYATQITGTAMILLAIAIVADFAAVVIAPGDDEVLFHLPLSSRTYLAARTTVAARHAAQMALAFGAAPSIVGGFVFRSAPFGFALLVAIVLTGWFALVLSFVLYRVALRLLGGERLRTTLAYLPGFVSLIATLGPQMLRSSGQGIAARSAAVTPLGAWAIALPPAWFSSFATLAGGDASPPVLARAAIGVVALPAAGLLLLRALGGTFLAELIRLVAARDAGPATRRAALARPAPGRLSRRLLGIRSPGAAAGYLLAVGAARSRESRARSFAFLMMPVAFTAIGFVRQGSTVLAGPLMGLFFLGAAAGTLVSMLPYHEHREAGWIHEALPFERYGAYALGVVRATLWRQVAPWMAALLAVAFVLDPTWRGVGLSIHVAAGSLLGIPLYVKSEDDPPFSRAFTPGESSGRVGIYLLTMLVLGVIAGVGAVLAAVAPLALIVTGPGLAVVFVLWMGAIGRRLDRHPPAFLRPAAPPGR